MIATTFDVLAAACRYNSGRSLLDSGDHYGRHHEAPPVAPDRPVATLDVYGDSVDGATLETAHYLAERCEHLDELQSAFDEFAADHEGDWFECGSDFMEERGYVQRARDNTYNVQSDLSQVYVWEVWSLDESERDWLYDESAVFVVYVHTGCDVRGGYSFPVFLKSTADYACPIDLQCEYRIIEARGLSERECREIDDAWTCGYSGWPIGEVRKSVKRWFPATLSPDRTSICAVLNSGHAVRIGVDAPISY